MNLLWSQHIGLKTLAARGYEREGPMAKGLGRDEGPKGPKGLKPYMLRNGRFIIIL